MTSTSTRHDARRSLVTACIAVAVHAPLLLAGTRALSSHTTADGAARELDEGIELTVLDVPAAGARSIPTAADATSGEPSSPSNVGAATTTPRAAAPGAPASSPHDFAATNTASATSTASATRANSVTGAAENGGATHAAAAPSGSAAPIALVYPPSLGLAGSGPNPFAGAGPREGAPSDERRPSATPEAPTASEAKRRAEQALKDGVRARDVDLGLGPEGPVLRALEDATYADVAPERGSATFLAVVDARGPVVDLRLLAATGPPRDWAGAPARALRARGGAKLALRGARGAELRIAVESDVRLPSGNRPRERIRGSFEESKVVLPENVPTGGMTTGVTDTRTLSTFDVTDIAAKPRRIVHARLLSLATL